MTVYADVAFAVNTAVNYLLLLLGARLTGYCTKPRRAFLAAAVGGIYAVCVLLPPLSFLGLFWGKLFCFFLMTAAAYGVRKKSVRPCAVFLLCTCALAGFVQVLGRSLPDSFVTFHSSVYYPAAQRMLLLLAGCFYLAAALLLTGTMRHGAGEIVKLILERGKKSMTVNALRDTGNTLCDPVTGKPVVVLEGDAATPLLGQNLSRELLMDAPLAVEYLHASCPELSARLIPYRAVGTECGLLVAIPCKGKLGKKRNADILVALSPGTVSDGGGYEALIGGTLF